MTTEIHRLDEGLRRRVLLRRIDETLADYGPRRALEQARQVGVHWPRSGSRTPLSEYRRTLEGILERKQTELDDKDDLELGGLGR